VDYLLRYAAWLDADIRTGRRVTGVRPEGAEFAVRFDDGEVLTARTVVAATGGFGRPYRPAVAGL
jgi:putative flavoprotein involved in K+ transport